MKLSPSSPGRRTADTRLPGHRPTSGSPGNVVAVLRDISIAVGTGIGRFGNIDTGLAPGMIGGQVVDIESEGVPPTADLVETIHRAKTGALITTAIVSGGIYGLGQLKRIGLGSRNSVLGEHCGTDEDTIARLRIFGEKAGLAFQIVDDILDMTQSSEELGKTAGKDTASVKATWPAVYGIEQSRRDAGQLIADAFAAVEPASCTRGSIRSSPSPNTSPRAPTRTLTKQ